MKQGQYSIEMVFLRSSTECDFLLNWALKKSAFINKYPIHTYHTLPPTQEEELHSTSRNYEEQMSVLTEHVAGMNDQLARQHDQIQELKQQASSRRK